MRYLFLYFSLLKFEEANQVQCTVVPMFGEPLTLVKDIALKEDASCKYFSVQNLNVLIIVLPISSSEEFYFSNSLDSLHDVRLITREMRFDHT